MSQHDDLAAPFQIPQAFLNKLYDLTGGSENDKGYLVFFHNEKGDPIGIVSHKSSQATIFSLAKMAEIWCNNFNERHSFISQSQMEEMEEV